MAPNFLPEGPNSATKGEVPPFSGGGGGMKTPDWASSLLPLKRSVLSPPLEWYLHDGTLPGVGAPIPQSACFSRKDKGLAVLQSYKNVRLAPFPQEADLFSCGSFSWNCCRTNPASRSSAGPGTAGSSSSRTPTRYNQSLGSQSLGFGPQFHHSGLINSILGAQGSVEPCRVLVLCGCARGHGAGFCDLLSPPIRRHKR